MHRVLVDSPEKWEVHVNLSNELARNPRKISVNVRDGTLLIYVDRTTTKEGWIFDKITIPSDVQFRALETAIKGNIMMISAPKNNSK